MKFGAGSNTNTKHLRSGLYEYMEFEHPGWKLIFQWNFHPTAENRHLKALVKESTCSLIIQTDFLKPLVNNGTRDEKIAIAKKYSAFPQQRTFARLYLLLKMGHHIMKSRNKLENELLLLEIHFEYSCPANITENRYRCFVCPLSLVFSCIRGNDAVHFICL